MRFFSGLSLLASLVVVLVSADHHKSKRNHAAIEVSKREGTEPSVFKRAANAQFTFYADGLGACGGWNKPGDFIVALNSQQFSASHCYETITITVGSKSAQATIVDECTGCGYNNLDFSKGLFDYFGSEAQGVLHGSWSWGSGNPQPSPSPSPSPWTFLPPNPKTSSSSSTTPSSSSSSSSKAPAFTAKVIPSSSITSSSISKYISSTLTSTASSSSSVPINVYIQTAGTFGSPQQADSSSLYELNMAFLGLSNLIASA